MDEVMKQITAYTKEAIIIMISNPLDVLTYYLQRKYDYPAGRIMGTGTLLDTARFKKNNREFSLTCMGDESVFYIICSEEILIYHNVLL